VKYSGNNIFPKDVSSSPNKNISKNLPNFQNDISSKNFESFKKKSIDDVKYLVNTNETKSEKYVHNKSYSKLNQNNILNSFENNAIQTNIPYNDNSYSQQKINRVNK
jgi:hypothetical protein